MKIRQDFSGKRFIALALSLILFAAVFVWDIPSSRAEEPPVQSPAPIESVEPEPTETPVETPLPTVEPTPLPTDELPQMPEIELPGDIQLPTSAAVTAEQVEPCATSGDYDYSDNGDGTVTITGYHGAGGDITIPSTIESKSVKVIGNSAFKGDLSITKVIIPSSVIQIQDEAFYECSNMTRAYFMGDAPNMGSDVFDKNFCPLSVYYRSDRIGFPMIWNNCVTVSCNPVITEPYSAYGTAGSSSEYDYWISEGKATIVKYKGSNGRVIIPSILDGCPVTAVGERAFYHSIAYDVTIPGCVRIISTEAFDGSCLIRVDIQNGAQWIGKDAFARTSLISVNLPTSLTTIQSSAFSACLQLKDIVIPENVNDIGSFAFRNCVNLNRAYFLGNAPTLGVDSMHPNDRLTVFQGCGNDFKICYMSGRTGFSAPWYGYQTVIFDLNNAHLVTFDPANGQAKIQINVGCGTIINPPITPSLKGWEFAGWVFSNAIFCRTEFPYRICNDASFEARYIPMTTNLTGIQLSAGTISPGFVFTTKKYKIVLGENEASVQITPIKECNGATVTINGKSVSSTTVSLANGKSKTITIKVKYGKKSSTYKFTVTRAKSGDNNLASLTNTAGVLSQPFDPNVTNYTLNLDENTRSVTLKAAKSNSMAKVSPASKKLILKNGQTKVLKFTVKAQSGAKKTYTVTVTRAPSTNTNLKTLKTSVPLSPGFSAGTTDYTLTLPADKGAVTISAKAFDKLSKVTINGAKKASQKITLANGQSTMVSVVVTSQAGTTKEYRILVQRP